MQQWALQYWIYLDRRTQVDDKKAELELSCYNVNYERWQQLYQNTSSGGDWGRAFDGEDELPITDPADLTEWYNNLDRQRGMSGAEVARIDDNFAFGYAEGSGRRV